MMNSSPFRVLLVLACAAVAAAVARAQEPSHNETGMRLELERGVTCLASEALRARLLHWLQSFPDDSAYRLVVRGSAHDPRTVVLRLHRRSSPEHAPVGSETEPPIAERRFSPGPRRCEDLHDAVAIAASMMLKAAYASEGAPLAPAEAEPAEPETSAPPPEPPEESPSFAAPLPHQAPASNSFSRAARRPAKTSSTKLSFVSAPRKRTPRGHPYLAAQAVLALDVGASPAGGAKLAAGIPLGVGFEARLGALALRSRMSPLEGTSGRYRTALVAGTIDVCRRFSTKSIAELRLCAGFLPSYLRASGFNFASPLEVPLFWPSISADLELALRLSRHTSLRFALTPVYALREVTLVARESEGSVVGSAELSRLGVMFGIGIGHELLRQGSAPSGHESP